MSEKRLLRPDGTAFTDEELGRSSELSKAEVQPGQSEVAKTEVRPGIEARGEKLVLTARDTAFKIFEGVLRGIGGAAKFVGEKALKALYLAVGGSEAGGKVAYEKIGEGGHATAERAAVLIEEDIPAAAKKTGEVVVATGKATVKAGAFAGLAATLPVWGMALATHEASKVLGGIDMRRAVERKAEVSENLLDEVHDVFIKEEVSLKEINDENLKNAAAAVLESGYAEGSEKSTDLIKAAAGLIKRGYKLDTREGKTALRLCGSLLDEGFDLKSLVGSEASPVAIAAFEKTVKFYAKAEGGVVEAAKLGDKKLTAVLRELDSVHGALISETNKIKRALAVAKNLGGVFLDSIDGMLQTAEEMTNAKEKEEAARRAA